jgi:glucose dehydrogenase
VIGGDDIALRDMVFLCDPSERLAALDDNVRRYRGTGVWAITRRSGGRRNIRTLSARGQKRTAAQYQRSD